MKRKIQEDMIGPADSPAYNPSPLHQIPATASPEDNMDVFSLHGPVKTKTKSKKNSKKSKKEVTTFPTNKVFTFSDFIGKKSTN